MLINENVLKMVNVSGTYYCSKECCERINHCCGRCGSVINGTCVCSHCCHLLEKEINDSKEQFQKMAIMSVKLHEENEKLKSQLYHCENYINSSINKFRNRFPDSPFISSDFVNFFDEDNFYIVPMCPRLL